MKMDLGTWRSQQEERYERAEDGGGRSRWARLARFVGAALVLTTVVGVAGASLLSSPARPALPPVAVSVPHMSGDGPETDEAGRVAAAEDTTPEATTRAAQEVPDQPPDPPPACPPVSGLLAADVDDDGCDDALRYRGGVIESASGRWAVGATGDELAVGDWWCRGRRTLAVLRPSTGDVYVFDAWAEPGGELTTGPAGRVEGGSALRAADLDGDGCHELMVARGEQPPVVVPLPTAEKAR